MAMLVCTQIRANTVCSLWANISRTLMFVEYRPLDQPSLCSHSAQRLQPSLDAHFDEITTSCPLPHRSPTSARLYLLRGIVVNTLIGDGVREVGKHSVWWEDWPGR